MDRIGAGFIAVLASVLFAMFDLTASLLVLLGFLIFRWAVIAAPILGTVGLMRPASAGLRRLANAVVAAVFNIAIFGTGAAIYLFAVDLIMNTATLPGWLQVVLVWLCGVVGWLLLRPYRRITQLGGKDSSEAVSSAGSWHRRFFRDMRIAARLDVAEPGGTNEPTIGRAPHRHGRPAQPPAGGPPRGSGAQRHTRRTGATGRAGTAGGGARERTAGRESRPARPGPGARRRPGPSRTCRRRHPPTPSTGRIRRAAAHPRPGRRRASAPRPGESGAARAGVPLHPGPPVPARRSPW